MSAVHPLIMIKKRGAVMSNEEKHPTAENASKEKGDKKNKPKSFLETVREIDEKERKREEEIEEKRRQILDNRRKKEREAYDKKIYQERIELMRLKQGIIDKSETIHEEKDIKTKNSLWKRIGNFFYHNKWWLVITVFITAIFGYMAFDYFTAIHPDMIVMVLTDDQTLQSTNDYLSNYFEQFIDDINNDGKIHVEIYNIPVDDNISVSEYYNGNMTKLSSQFQMADAIMVITDAVANKTILADDTLVNLEGIFPDNKNVRNTGFYIRNTDFMEKVGYTGVVLDRDICIGLRKPVKTMDSKAEMQENYDIALSVLEKIMDDLPYVQKNRTFDTKAEGGMQ